MSSQIWMEPTSLHFHTGHEARIKLYQGEQMVPQAPELKDDISVKLMNNDGSKMNLSLAAAENEEDYFLITFNPDSEGLYTLAAKTVDGKFAQIIVPVGHHLHGEGSSTGEELEIVPEAVGEFRLNDNVTFSVLSQGEPLAGTEIKATYHLYDGGDYPHTFKTDKDGKAQFTFSAKGHWMFRVNYKGKVATFVVPGVR